MTEKVKVFRLTITDHGQLSGLNDPEDHPMYTLKATLTAKGSIYVATAAGAVSQLLIGSDGLALVADSTQATGIKWAAGAGGGVTDHGALTGLGDDDHATVYTQRSLFTGKGALLAASAANTPATLVVGANDTVLTADNAEITGMKWVAPSGSMIVGSYTGNGADDRDITDAGVGTRTPRFVIVYGRDGLFLATMKSSQDGLYSKTAQYWSLNRIQALIPGGFQVGDSSTVNGNGKSYTYVIFL